MESKMKSTKNKLVFLVLLALAGLVVACSTGGKGAQPELAGTEWTLISLNGEALIEGTEINLYFEETQLGGKMTCNGYGGGPDSGGYSSTTKGKFEIPMLAVTVQYCPTPEGVMEQEAAYIETLRAAVQYRVIENRLELLDSSGATTLVFDK
jgi:heat shock protein HslJ